MAVFIRTRVGAQLHGDGRVGRGADTGIHDDRHPGLRLDDPEVVRVLDAEAGADRRAQRHHRGGARVLELAAHDGIVVGVRQDDEPFVDQDPRGFEQRFVVGEQRLLVADHFQLDPVRQARLAPQPRRANRVVRGVARGGVRQDEVPLGIDVVEQRFLAAVGEVDAPHRDGDHLGARRLVRRRITWWLGYLPVPMISRDMNGRPAMKKALMDLVIW